MSCSRQDVPRRAVQAAACVLIVVAGLLAYGNSFDGVFVYDDIRAIRDNRHIRVLWPVSEALSVPLWGTGWSLDGRPVLSLSFALTHALFGPEPWGFHGVNLGIHICAGLLLFGVVRRTLARLPIEDCRLKIDDERSRLSRTAPQSSIAIAFAIAVLWLVHPLTTSAVTYIVQRAESLMGMFFLLTLYCAVRGFQSDNSGRSDRSDGSGDCRPLSRSDSRLWYSAAILSCALGMLTKEVMVTAPLLVALYDITFVSGSLRRASRRWGFYGWLFGTCLLLLVPLAVQAEFAPVSPVQYALTQPGVILHYLRLAVWPHPLAMTYDWPLVTRIGEALVPAAVLFGLLAIGVRGLLRRRWYGFAGAWFFLVLVPSSTVFVLEQNAAEHRMYLPLAAVIAVAVIGGGYGLGRLVPSRFRSAVATGAVCAVLASFLFLTVERNRDYQDALRLWSRNVRTRPRSATAHSSLGGAMVERGAAREAVPHLQRSLELRPGHVVALYNLGKALTALGRLEEAEARYREAVKLAPRHALAHNNLGLVLHRQGRLQEAILYYGKAVKVDPDLVPARSNLGMALGALGDTGSAAKQLGRAVELDPDSAVLRNNLGMVLLRAGKPGAALPHLREAVRIAPGDALAHYNCAEALLGLGKPEEAAPHLEKAVQVNPQFEDARRRLDEVLQLLGRDEVEEDLRGTAQP